jgi:hypothetical protein
MAVAEIGATIRLEIKSRRDFIAPWGLAGPPSSRRRNPVYRFG